MSQIGEINESLILKCNGILLLKIGNKTINMLDSDGNLNIKLKNIIKPELPNSNSDDGIYCYNGKIWIKSEGTIYQISIEGNSSGSSLPKGSIIMYDGTTAPNGWYKYADSETFNGVIYITNDDTSSPLVKTVALRWNPSTNPIIATLGEAFTSPIIEKLPSSGISIVVDYSSSNTSVASVDGNGNVTLKSEGQTIITAKTNANLQHGAALASYRLVVTKPLETVKSFETLISEFNSKGIYSPSILNSGNTKDIYLYLLYMYNKSRNEYENEDVSVLFKDKTYEDLEVYNYHGTNKTYENDGTAENAMLYWTIAMCLSELVTSSGNNNPQTRLFKFAYDLGGLDGDGRKIKLYDNYSPKGDLTICRLVASFIYAKYRKNYKDQISSFRDILGGSEIPITSSNGDKVWAESLQLTRASNPNGNSPTNYGYTVNIGSIFPSAAGPYANGYKNRSSYLEDLLGQDLFDSDHNYKVDKYVNNEVITNYNLADNPNLNEFVDRIVLAIADDYEGVTHYLEDRTYYTYPSNNGNITYPHDTFKEAANSNHYFTGVFNNDVVVSKNLSLYKFTSNFTTLLEYIREAVGYNRYTILDPLYGRRRPALGENNPSMFSDNHNPQNWLDDHSILHLVGGSTKYDETALKYYVDYNNNNQMDSSESSYYPHGGNSVYATTYPSGHSSGIWGVALVLIELLSEFENTTDTEMYNIYKAAYKFTVSRTIVRAHWNSDIIYGKLNSTTIIPTLHNMANFSTIYNNAKNALSGSSNNELSITINNQTGSTAYITGEILLFFGVENNISKNIYITTNKFKDITKTYAIPTGSTTYTPDQLKINTPTYLSFIGQSFGPAKEGDTIRVYGWDGGNSHNKFIFSSTISLSTFELTSLTITIVLGTSYGNMKSSDSYGQKNIDISYTSTWLNPSYTGVKNTIVNLPVLYIKDLDTNLVYSWDNYEYWDDLKQYLTYEFRETGDTDYASINSSTGVITLGNTLTNGYGSSGRGICPQVRIVQNSSFISLDAHFYINILEPSTSTIKTIINNQTGANAYITGEIYFWVTGTDTTKLVMAGTSENILTGSTGRMVHGNSLIILPPGETRLDLAYYEYQGGTRPVGTSLTFAEHEDSNNNENGVTEAGVRVYGHGVTDHVKFAFKAEFENSGVGLVFNEGSTDYTYRIRITKGDSYDLMYKPSSQQDTPIITDAEYTVGLISDMHFAFPNGTTANNGLITTNNNGNGDYSNSEIRFEEDLLYLMLNKFTNTKFISSPGDVALYNINDFILFTKKYNSYKTNNLPFYCSTGNHDHGLIYCTGNGRCMTGVTEIKDISGGRWNDCGSNYPCPGSLATATSDITKTTFGSKGSYFILCNGDIYLYLMLDYGVQRGGKHYDDNHYTNWNNYTDWDYNDWTSPMHAHNQLDSSNEHVIYMMNKCNKKTIFSSSTESNFNFLYYNPFDLHYLGEFLEKNKSKRIFIFSHHPLPNKAGGASHYSTGGSANLMGLTFYYLNYLNNIYKDNTVWFSGHTHFKWTDNFENGIDWTHDNYNCITPSSTDNIKIVNNWTNSNMFACDNAVYSRGSGINSENPVSAWNIHLPSMSRPVLQGTGSLGSLCEGAIMNVYLDRVEITKIGATYNNGSYSDYSGSLGNSLSISIARGTDPVVIPNINSEVDFSDIPYSEDGESGKIVFRIINGVDLEAWLNGKLTVYYSDNASDAKYPFESGESSTVINAKMKGLDCALCSAPGNGSIHNITSLDKSSWKTVSDGKGGTYKTPYVSQLSQCGISTDTEVVSCDHEAGTNYTNDNVQTWISNNVHYLSTSGHYAYNRYHLQKGECLEITLTSSQISEVNNKYFRMYGNWNWEEAVKKYNLNPTDYSSTRNSGNPPVKLATTHYLRTPNSLELTNTDINNGNYVKYYLYTKGGTLSGANSRFPTTSNGSIFIVRPMLNNNAPLKIETGKVYNLLIYSYNKITVEDHNNRIWRNDNSALSSSEFNLSSATVSLVHTYLL